jgi:hypothetical protein
MEEDGYKTLYPDSVRDKRKFIEERRKEALTRMRKQRINAEDEKLKYFLLFKWELLSKIK